MRVTNACNATLGFPCGASIDPGESAEVDDAHLDHPVVAGWVDEGKIVIGEGEAEKPAPKKGAKRSADKGE